jgi:hypothetical protein
VGLEKETPLMTMAMKTRTLAAISAVVTV